MMILITGAASGIGEFLCKKLSESGKKIVGTYHRRLPKTADIIFEKIDITRENEVKALASEFKVNEIIHCAGTNKNGLTQNLETSDWETVLDTNLKSSFLICKHFLPHMQEDKFGRIILVSSIVPQIGVPGAAAYSASKAGLWGLTKTISQENARKNITCNCLNLGYFDIGMIKDVPEKFLSKIIEKIPLQRLGNPDNIYNAVKFILESDYLTGACIDINGGLV